MTERYAFRYNEFLIQQKEKNWLFPQNEFTSPLFADIYARFQGIKPIYGGDFCRFLGVHIQNTSGFYQDLFPQTEIYGADACRIALLENQSIKDNHLKAGWCEVDKIWHLLSEKTAEADFRKNVFTPFIQSIQNKDLKRAWIELKTLSNLNLNINLSKCFYPFVPHVVQSIYPDIHIQMADFFQCISNIVVPQSFFLAFNAHIVGHFIPENNQSMDKIKNQALSFPVIQNMIKNRKIKNIIIIPNKGVNIVV